MYHRIQAYFAGVKPVFIDGTLYVLLAFFGAVILTFNNDDIYKYVEAHFVFWIKNTSEWMMAVTTAIKMFRSTAYADHLDEAQMKIDGTKPAPILPPVPDPKQQALNKVALEAAIVNKIHEKTLS